MYIKVEFDTGGQQYVYTSPVVVKRGQYVLVNVYGVVKAAKVTATKTKGTYSGPVKSIVGLGFLLEDLEQGPIEKDTLTDKFIRIINGY